MYVFWLRLGTTAVSFLWWVNKTWWLGQEYVKGMVGWYIVWWPWRCCFSASSPHIRFIISDDLNPSIANIFWTSISYLEPQRTIYYKLMFGETTIFYIKIWNHPIKTSIYKWLFGVPGLYFLLISSSEKQMHHALSHEMDTPASWDSPVNQDIVSYPKKKGRSLMSHLENGKEVVHRFRTPWMGNLSLPFTWFLISGCLSGWSKKTTLFQR